MLLCSPLSEGLGAFVYFHFEISPSPLFSLISELSLSIISEPCIHLNLPESHGWGRWLPAPNLPSVLSSTMIMFHKYLSWRNWERALNSRSSSALLITARQRRMARPGARCLSNLLGASSAFWTDIPHLQFKMFYVNRSMGMWWWGERCTVTIWENPTGWHPPATAFCFPLDPTQHTYIKIYNYSLLSLFGAAKT